MTTQFDTDMEDQIEEQAADWVLRLSEGSLSDETIEEWRRWIDTSPEHRCVYEKMSELWGMADDLKVLDERAAAQVSTQLEPAALEEKNSGWRGFIQGLSHALRGPRLAMASMLVVAVSVATYVYFPGQGSVEMSRLEAIAGMQTGKGQHGTYNLPDGSTLELAADSRIQMAYSDGERRILLLRGEALFDVAKDPSRPFIVDTSVGEYQALGTVFNVHIGNDASTLTVVEGIVQASVDTEEGQYNGVNYPRLIAGETVSISNDGEIGDVTQIDPNAVIAWRDGLFSFVDVPLADVFADLNRYLTKPIVVDEEVSQLRYTGSINRDSIDSMISVLPEAFPVRVVEVSDKIMVRAKF